MKFIPFARHIMETIHKSDIVRDKRWAVISISAFGNYPDVVRTESCRGVLQLTFADIDEPWLGQVLFSEEQARSILEFVKQMEADKVDLMAVHCRAGLSRSPAVCAALSEVYGQKSEDYFHRYIPNMHVYRTLLETHQKGKQDGD